MLQVRDDTDVRVCARTPTISQTTRQHVEKAHSAVNFPTVRGISDDHRTEIVQQYRAALGTEILAVLEYEHPIFYTTGTSPTTCLWRHGGTEGSQ